MATNKYKLFKFIGLKIIIIVDNLKAKLFCTGFLSKFVRRIFYKELNYFDDEKYILELNDNIKKKNSLYFKRYGNSLIYSTWIPPIPSKVFYRMTISRIIGIFGFIKPEQITISVTEKCPNKCIHCALPNKYNSLEMDLNILKKIIDEALSIGFTSVIFDGGETILYPYLE